METLILMSPAFFFGGIIGFVFLIVMFLANRKIGSPALRIFQIIVLVFSVIMILVPVGILFLMRQEIKNERKDEYYVDTGIYAKANIDEQGICSFEYDGEEYTQLILDMEDCFEYIDNSHAGKGIAVFNLKEDLNFLEKAIGLSDDHVMYEAKNGTGFTMYSDNDRLFYPVAHEKEIKKYYTSFDHYTWQFVKEEGVKDAVRVDLKLSKKDLKAIEAMSNETADVPLDPNDYYLNNTVYSLEKISPDGIYTGTIEIIGNKKGWYWISEMTDGDKDDEDALPLCHKLPEHVYAQFGE